MSVVHSIVAPRRKGQNSGPPPGSCTSELHGFHGCREIPDSYNSNSPLIKIGLELMDERRDPVTSNFGGEDCLLHCEECGGQSSDTDTLQFAARLETFPSSGDLDAES